MSSSARSALPHLWNRMDLGEKRGCSPVPRLHEMGSHVVVYVPARGQGWLRAQLEGSGVQFEIFDIVRPFSPQFARWLAGSFAAHGIQVAHSHEFTFAVYGAWAGKLAGVPQVATCTAVASYTRRGNATGSPRCTRPAGRGACGGL
jgi:hypothetical protein